MLEEVEALEEPPSEVLPLLLPPLPPPWLPRFPRRFWEVLEPPECPVLTPPLPPSEPLLGCPGACWWGVLAGQEVDKEFMSAKSAVDDEEAY